MNDNSAMLVLVDENDNETGNMEKLEAHREGALHRAISVFIFDVTGRVLLQKRNRNKYHSKSQWANACCSHPLPGELPFVAAHRRLQEEMGFDCTLRFLFKIIYKHDVGEGLTEHELVHVFAGRYTGPIRPDPEEAEGYQWIAFDDLLAWTSSQPQSIAPWLRIYLNERAVALRNASSE